MADAAPKPLVESWLDWLAHSIDTKGVELPNALLLDRAGELTVYALAVPPDQGYQLMLAECANRQARELIFAFDRFAKPGQGTTLGDLMAGHHYAGGRWRPFVVEYQHEPRIVKPICWSNLFWNAVLTGELQAAGAEVIRKAAAARGRC